MDNEIEIDSWVVGHHVFQHVWTPTIGEVLLCQRETNAYDQYAVGVYRHGTLVGRVPREHSRQLYGQLERNRMVICVITGPRENRRRRGLEVPCIYQYLD